MDKILGKRNAALDGVRAVAITVIVADHTGILMQGGLGNTIFFCLSGFLASVPFRDDVEKDFLSIKSILNYYLGRLIRILPIYYVVIVGHHLISGGFFSDGWQLLRNALFLEGTSHLWFLQQEMWMYACVPFIFLCLNGIRRVFKHEAKDIACACVLFVLAFATKRYLTEDIIYLYGNGARTWLRIGLFLIGMAFGYLYKTCRKTNVIECKWTGIVCDGYMIAFLLLIVISSEQILRIVEPAYQGFYIGWAKPMLCAILAGIFVLALLINPHGLCAKILGCRPIAYVGKVSFGIYLNHMFFVPLLVMTSKPQNFLAVYLVSICIATALYRLIERPSMIMAKTRNKTEVIRYYQNL